MDAQKLAWIRSKIGIIHDFGDLNTLNLVANPVPQGLVLKPLSVAAIAGTISASDRRLLQNEGAYKSLLQNLEKGQFLDVLACIQNLATTPNLSEDGITKLNNAIVTAQETELDPNWQPQILATPAELAGFSPVTLQEWEEANEV
jgi:hypothetical protein